MRKIILIVMILSSLLFGNDTQYEITPLLGYDVNPKEIVEIGDHEVFGFSVSKNSDNLLFSKLEVGLLQSKNLNYDDTTMSTKITQIFFNGVKDYNMNDNFKLFALGGLGYERISNEYLNNKSKPFVNYGAGVEYTFANNFSLRIDGKHQFKIDADSSLIYTIGLSIPFTVEDKPLIVNVPAKTKDKPLIVNVPSNLLVLFEYNDDKIKYTDISKLEKYVSYLNKVSTATILVEGHTSSIRRPKYNLDLSQRRADSVKEQLISMGIAESRIKTINYGETKPIVENNIEENRKQNRRAVISIENKE